MIQFMIHSFMGVMCVLMLILILIKLDETIPIIISIKQGKMY